MFATDSIESLHHYSQPIHLAIGMFDGLHIGHQAVIRACMTTASSAHGHAGVLTFWPHPSRILRPDKPTLQIMTPRAKHWTLERLGLDILLTLPFEHQLSEMEASAFVPFLKSAIPSLQSIFVGEQFRFGKGRNGDVSILQKQAQAHEVHLFSMQQCRYDGTSISSTRIRAMLASGAFNELSMLLGHPYTAVGPVVQGRGVGKTIGYPTINIDWQPELQPPHGVYAVRVLRPGSHEPLQGIANYGNRPTFHLGDHCVLEVFLLNPPDFAPQDHEVLAVEMLHFIREEQCFPSVNALTDQISRDIANARTILGNL